MFATDGDATAPPVALLARPGMARERLREALHLAGAAIVLEDAPEAVDAQTLADAAPAVVLIALEPAIEQALERLDTALERPGITVIFDEADLAARREGWEAQRWVRHLAAKLHGHQDVLPPGGESDSDLPPALQVPAAAISAQALDHASIQVHLEESASPAQVPDVASIHVHLEEAASFAEAIPGDALYTWKPPRDVAPGFEDLSFAPHTEPVADPIPTPPLIRTAPSIPVAPSPSASASWSLVDHDTPPVTPPPRPPAERIAISTEGLSLVALETEAGATTANAGAVTPTPTSASTGTGTETPTGTATPAADVATAAPGAVLVMAGIGGPDAIRRLLAALPSHFPLPLLVQLRLDGGRYANLVKQIARVSALPVLLAEADQAVCAGHVYILPDDIGVRSADAAGLRFVAQAAGASVVDGLPAAHSAVLLLSGSDPQQVDAVLALAEQGAWVAGQSGEGCYDPTAAAQLILRGHPGGEPVQLAQALRAQWGG
nr:chemotaxis protein CheB [Xanthomonas sp. GPE 39]